MECNANLYRNMTRRRFLKYGLHWAMVAGLAPSLWLWGCSSRYPAKRPNIIFILIDALRADRLGSFGNTVGLSPTLDTIAEESVVFERAIAQAPWTQPSIASLFCSYHPGVHKVLDFRQAARSMNPNVPKVAVFNGSFVTVLSITRYR